MRNKDRDPSLYENDTELKKDLYIDPYKTTNVNILLNRVRLNKKKSLKKKLFFSAILLAMVSGLIAYLLI
ncbi:hypothetical protein [Candidatus Pelagibacter sp.]|uniref:hypothetical protein n=1 Tax=Candidatus Pelagibacter sp. TaxID=2024849 RepID=UPI003D14A9DA